MTTARRTELEANIATQTTKLAQAQATLATATGWRAQMDARDAVSWHTALLNGFRAALVTL